MKMASQYQQRKLLRLSDFDSSQAGAYFVTICAYNKKCIFGHVIEDGTHLNNLGELIVKIWSGLPQTYAFISLDNWVLMPNHFQAIIWLNENTSGKTLSQVIAYFKAVTTSLFRRQLRQPINIWQRGFFEHI